MVLAEILGIVAASVVVLLSSRIAQIEERFPRRLGLDSDKTYTYYGGAEKAEVYFKLNNIFELKMKSQSAAKFVQIGFLAVLFAVAFLIFTYGLKNLTMP
jgi:hypothetical protein